VTAKYVAWVKSGDVKALNEVLDAVIASDMPKSEKKLVKGLQIKVNQAQISPKADTQVFLTPREADLLNEIAGTIGFDIHAKELSG